MVVSMGGITTNGGLHAPSSLPALHSFFMMMSPPLGRSRAFLWGLHLYFNIHLRINLCVGTPGGLGNWPIKDRDERRADYLN